MKLFCSRCGKETAPEKLLKIESEHQHYQYCITCLKIAHDILSMKIAPNKEERRLLKSIRKFLKHVKN